MPHPAKDLTGQRFGYLTVISRAGSTTGKTKCATWLCRCDCGNQVVRVSQYLRKQERAHPRSCGCHHGNETHKMSQSRVFSNYYNMLRRCYAQKDKDFQNYGGRGITVCERWRESFENFWEDMGPTHQPGLSLDRVDNNGPYSPENCRWTTRSVQANNQRTNRVVDTPNGKMSLADAARAVGMTPGTVYNRVITLKWPLEAALATPVRQSRCMT